MTESQPLSGEQWRQAARKAISARHGALRKRRGRRREKPVTGIRIPPPDAPERPALPP